MTEVVVDAARAEWREIPWLRIWRLLHPSRARLAAMVSLSLAGSAAGLVAPIALGAVVTALERHRDGTALWCAGAIACAFAVEAGAYLASDACYASITADVLARMRRAMFDGLGPLGPEMRARFSSRFVSDVETFEELTVGALDQASMGLFDLVAALAALALLDGSLVAVVAGGVAVWIVVVRALRAPVARAGLRRQEDLELMSSQLSSGEGFDEAVARVAAAERRVGRISAAHRHAGLALSGVGPAAVVFAGVLHGVGAGALLSAYLLSTRAFVATDVLFDIKLDVELARGAVARCFALVDRAAMLTT